MKSRCTIGGSILLLALSAFALPALGEEASEEAMPRSPDEGMVEPSVNRTYYGATVGLSLGDYFSIGVAPFVGYWFHPKASVGGRVAYQYVRDTRYAETLTAHNYGGSVFFRYRFVPQLYGHAELAGMSFKYSVSDLESERSWVPFLFLGGGWIQPIAPRTSLIIEVLFDVLQDEKSPYEDWTPFISIGVGVGF